MLTYLIRRLIYLFPVLFLVVTAVFFLLRIIPGDPVDFILGENALPVEREALTREHHFDRPLLEQYGIYLKNVANLSFGKSFFSQESVSSLILKRYPATIELAISAILWACLIAFPLGIMAALKKDRTFDQASLIFSLFGISIPSFYLGPLLVLFFSITLDWFPVSGREMAGSLFLPSLTLGAAMAALLTRMTRSAMVEVLQKDYIKTAHAKGLATLIVIVKHAFVTALLPVVAILGLQFGTLLAGAIVTEKIFSWPGIGTLLLEAISQRDYAVVQGCILVIAGSYVVINLLTDLVYARLDPRIKLE